MNNYNRHQERKSSLWGGLILLVVGVFLLMKKLDLHIPHWIFSWETILIAIGLILGAKRNFTGAGWIILVCIGGIFLIDDIFNWGVNMSRFIWPLVFICAGIFLVVQSTERRRREIILQPGENAEDYIANTSLFGGSKKVVFSKNFRGGYISDTFGGSEINLSQADFNGVAILDVQCLFGGSEITVPPHWEVRINVSSIFGGVDDARIQPVTINPDKILIIKGSCTFGGVSVKN